MPLEPQAALEQATLNALRNELGYTDRTSGRTFQGHPPPLAGNVFASVWWPGRRQSLSRTCLDEVQGVYVTLTLRLVKPFDRWIEHVDDLERRCNAVRALLHNDTLTYDICRAAAVLAVYDTDDTRPIGFREALMFEGLDDYEVVGPDWFHGHVDGKSQDVGLKQTVRCGKARRLQAIATAT